MNLFRLWLSSVLIISLLCSFQIPASAAGSTVNVRYESRFLADHPEWTSDVLVENGRVLLPVRDLASMLQLQVRWNNDRKVATFVQPGRELALSAATNEATVNGRVYQLDVPLTIRKQRIYVPVRFVAEWFDGEARWDAKTRTVLIKDNSPFLSASLGEEMYWFDHLEGTLYRSVGARTPVKLGTFKVPDGSGFPRGRASERVEPVAEHSAEGARCRTRRRDRRPARAVPERRRDPASCRAGVQRQLSVQASGAA